MDDGRHDLAVSGAVASQFVGDQLPGRTALPLQQLAEESFGGVLITARLDEDIDYITILVYRAPEVLAFTLHLYEDLVQVPCVTETTLPTLQSPSVFRPELNPNRKIFAARKRETAALGAGEKLVLGHPLAATIGDSARCMQNLEKVLFTGPKTSDTVTFICD